MRRSSSVSNVQIARDTVIDLDFGPEDKKKETIEYEQSEITVTTESEAETGNADE